MTWPWCGRAILAMRCGLRPAATVTKEHATLEPVLVSLSIANLDETIRRYHENLDFTVKRRTVAEPLAVLAKESSRLRGVRRDGLQMASWFQEP